MHRVLGMVAALLFSLFAGLYKLQKLIGLAAQVQLA